MAYQFIQRFKTTVFWAIPIIGLLGVCYIDFNPDVKIPIPNNVNQIHQTITSARPIFLAILIESFPFVIFGALLSSFIQEFVSVDAMCRYLPRNRVLSVLVGGLLGVVVPICDCGTIPIARSLLIKGVPEATVVAFTLAAPVVNPITLAATFVAFGLNIRITLLRGLLTYCIACTVGYMSVKHKVVKERQAFTRDLSPSLASPNTSYRLSDYIQGTWKRMNNIVDHTVKEFFSISGLLICGAAVSSLYQAYHVQHVGGGAAHLGSLEVVTTMLLAILFSLCSEADAFVARSFLSTYSFGSVLSFMLIGQMADLRNLFLLPRTFGRRIGIVTIIGCLSLCFLVGSVISGLR
ncbi:permease [Alicyclobacillus fastidiosus]|uniref:Permease n=1 Tax=Alicyclobacillus fastidiosus TaxID=392011 RepID=A0ABY6ZC44_9BACL|nr:permease [Alicyclobacillus fastidiosus]WAH39779.1 permease [Alicyclobacillus fastidiosus]GMA61029.1 permease [Alicyclobacillus fastidiosus]